MRVDVKKCLFVGALQKEQEFFQKAQKLGFLQFVSLHGEKKHILPAGVEKIKDAIRILKKQPVCQQESREDLDSSSLVQKIIELYGELETVHEEMRNLQEEHNRMYPLGYFDLEELKEIAERTERKIQFFMILHDRMPTHEIPKELIYIGHELDFDYYMYMGKEEFFHPSFSEVIVNKSLRAIEKRQKELKEIEHGLKAELKKLAVYLEHLQNFLLQELNVIYRNFARDDIDIFLDHTVFAVEAWVPENKLSFLYDWIKNEPVYFETVAIDENDKVPTYLENSGYAKVGQDLVEIFDTPSTTDKDPSLWVLGSFSVFFGMIIADAGYGFLFLLASLFCWIKFAPKEGIKRRILQMTTLLSCTTILWGILVASYFSIHLSPSNPFNKYSFIYYLAENKAEYHMNMQDETYQDWLKTYPRLQQLKNPHEVLLYGVKVKDGVQSYALMEDLYNTILMEIAILFGIIHLSISFLRNLYRDWSGIGWILCLWGGYLFFPKVVGAISLVQYLGIMPKALAYGVGQIILYGGLAVALILSLVQQGFSGLNALFKIIEVFADTLSYLRLYALGLASMVMAGTFNQIGMQLSTQFAGMVGGILIILLGHIVNMSLGIMAGVIHGLRLNFLEWYHHSFEGGGYCFNPLRLLIRENN